MNFDPIFLVAGLACVITLAVLMTGIGGFARGGEFNRRNGNRLMRWRIIGQAVAIALMMLYLWHKGL